MLQTVYNLSKFFKDADGDALTYALAENAVADVASALVDGGSLSITPPGRRERNPSR